MIRIAVTLMAGLLAGSLSAGTIKWQTLDLGNNEYRLQYSVSQIVLLANQELDILFDPAVYRQLSNPVVPAGLDVLLLQPNNPPGTAGDFSMLALNDNPDLSGGFFLDVMTFATAGLTEQRFEINQLNSQGVVVSTIDQGLATAVPEPANVLAVGSVLFLAGFFPAVRCRFKKKR